MNKKISLGAAIAFMLVVAAITFCITMMVSLNHFNDMVLNVKAREEMYKKLADVDRNTRQNFAGKIDEEALNNAICNGYLKGIGDKYSTYLTKDEYEQRLLELSGKLVQIGINIKKDQTGYFTVMNIIKNSPASAGGIAVNDLLISIDDTDLKNITLAEAERLLKGDAGTKVKLVYRRDGVDTSKELQRKDLDVQFVSSALIGDNGYIKIDEFNEKTPDQFKKAVDSLIENGATAFLFDLRGNNSDSIDAAAKMLNTLLPSGSLGTKIDKNGKDTSLGNSDKYEIKLPMATIVNSKTGNAAEYFAAVLRDFGRSNTIGTLTLGKAVSQELIQITDGSAINITTSYILPPSKNEINGVGIKPDYEVKLTTEQEQNFATLTADTDPQIQKGIEVVNSKKVS